MRSNRSHLPAIWRSFSDWPAFRRAMGDFFQDPFFGLDREFFGRWEDDSFSPSAEMDELEDRYLLRFDLPGIPKENLRVQVTDNVLTISGERHFDNRDARLKGRGERYDRFLQTVRLPEDAQCEKIDAIHRDSLLEIVIPKAERARQREVPIREAEKQQVA